MFKQYRLRDYRFSLVVLVLAISIIGVLVVGSAKSSLQIRQIQGVCFGMVVLAAVSFVDYTYYMNFYWLLYAGNLVLLLLVRFAGEEVNYAKRWLVIAGIQFQPSELAKILLILFFAKFIMLHKENLNTLRTLATAFLLLALPLYLIYAQPDLSTSIAIAGVFCVMLYIGGLSYKFILTVLAILVPSLIVFISLVVQPNQKILKAYQYNRIMAWLYPEKYASSTALQQLNSIIAVGSGQLTGKGLNNNIVGSVKNGNFISEPQTDFIFAIAGEELGFIGSCVIVGLLACIVLECIWIGMRAKDLAGRIICVGIGSLIGLQSFINIGVATGLLPNTGIPLPFVSYGLTSLVTLFFGIGIVLNVGLQRSRF
jgi:rod shape determining protein RodA